MMFTNVLLENKCFTYLLQLCVHGSAHDVSWISSISHILCMLWYFSLWILNTKYKNTSILAQWGTPYAVITPAGLDPLYKLWIMLQLEVSILHRYALFISWGWSPGMGDGLIYMVRQDGSKSHNHLPPFHIHFTTLHSSKSEWSVALVTKTCNPVHFFSLERILCPFWAHGGYLTVITKPNKTKIKNHGVTFPWCVFESWFFLLHMIFI